MSKPHYLRKKRKVKGPARPHGVKTKRRKKPTLADKRRARSEKRTESSQTGTENV